MLGMQVVLRGATFGAAYGMSLESSHKAPFKESIWNTPDVCL